MPVCIILVYTHELYTKVKADDLKWETHPHDSKLRVARIPWEMQCPATPEEKSVVSCDLRPIQCAKCERHSCILHRHCPTRDSKGVEHGLRYTIPMSYDCNLFRRDVPRVQGLSLTRGFEKCDLPKEEYLGVIGSRGCDIAWPYGTRGCTLALWPEYTGNVLPWDHVRRQPLDLLQPDLYHRMEDEIVKFKAGADARLVIDTYNLDACTRSIAKVGLYSQVARPPGSICVIVMSYLQPGFPGQTTDLQNPGSLGMELYDTTLNSFRVPSHEKLAMFFEIIQMPPG